MLLASPFLSIGRPQLVCVHDRAFRSPVICLSVCQHLPCEHDTSNILYPIFIKIVQNVYLNDF